MSTRRILGIALLAVLAFLMVNRAEAIPAFARKHKLSCSTCHAPFPRLKPFGEEFAGRGFRMPPGQEPARATYDVGDPLLELPRNLPLAVRLDGYAAWNEDAAAEADLEFPYVFKLLSGGPISKKVSYYVYFILEKGEVEGLEDAYLQISSLGGKPFDLMFGQFQVSDPMFKREARLQRLDYEIYKTRVGESQSDLTYERGLMGVWGAPGGFDVVFQVVNGNGIHDDAADFDRDSYKNVALRVGRQFGPVRAGLFGYGGREEGDNGLRNSLSYWGPDLVFDIDETMQVNVQYMERRDDNPFFLVAPGEEIVTRGGFVELVYQPRGPDGRWAWTALYNKVSSGDTLARRESAAVSGSWLLARNVRLLVEAGRDMEGSANTASAGIIAAF
jgi:hypothetical protein